MVHYIMVQVAILIPVVVRGSHQFYNISRAIVDETCRRPALTEADYPAYVALEMGVQHSLAAEFEQPFGVNSLRTGLAGLSSFLNLDRHPDYAACHQLLVEDVLQLATFAYRIEDFPRMRILVYLANLFKLVGIRNWYRQILDERDRDGTPLDDRRAPFAKLYTAVSFRQQMLYRALAVDKLEMVKSTTKIPVNIVSLCAYPGGSPMRDLAWSNHNAYAARHGYTYRMITEVQPAYIQTPQFFKNRLIVDWTVDPNPTADWLLFVDCDAFFTNFDTQIEDLIQTYVTNTTHVLVAEDNGGINTGVMLVRRSQWSLDLFAAAMKHHHMSMAWDQSMVFYELVSRSNWNDLEVPLQYPPAGVVLVHQGHLNAYHEGTARSWNTYAWTKGDFIKHFAGCPSSETFCLDLMTQTVDDAPST